MIKSHLVLRTAPAKPVDESSFLQYIYICVFPYLKTQVVWVAKSMDAVDKFQVQC